MKIFGVSMVRNEADIIGLTVLNNLSLGLDRVLVLDNGSTDGTDKILRALAKEDKRVRYIQDDSPFNQAAITTELAREAHRQGADWILPFDADEFYWASRGNFRQILADSEAGALRVYPINFIQARSQHESNLDALLSMTRRAAESVPPGRLARRMTMSHQIGFLQMAYPEKWISRPTVEIEIGRGNHIVWGTNGKHAKGHGITCFHAPLRSRSLLASKMERSHRLQGAGVVGEAWHVWHWARMIEEGKLDEEWAANSYQGKHLDVYGQRYRVVFDPRLRNVIAPLIQRLRRNPAITPMLLSEDHLSPRGML